MLFASFSSAFPTRSLAWKPASDQPLPRAALCGRPGPGRSVGIIGIFMPLRRILPDVLANSLKLLGSADDVIEEVSLPKLAREASPAQVAYASNVLVGRHGLEPAHDVAKGRERGGGRGSAVQKEDAMEVIRHQDLFVQDYG